MIMKIILGLGNPGVVYASTRHNSGMMLVDEIFKIQYSRFNDNYGWRRKKNIVVAEFPDLILVKTAEYFMNESGNIIGEFLKNSPLPHPFISPLQNFGEGLGERLYLAHDDLDIKLGEYKIQFGVGPKEHNGVDSVENRLGTKQFWRIRIGIDNRESENRIPGEEYVLKKFTAKEIETLTKVFEMIGAEVCGLAR